MKKIILILLLLFFVSGLTANDFPSTFVFPTYYHTYGIRKAGPVQLFLFMGFKVKFKNPQGLACVRLDSWEDPQDKHDDDEVTVYGVNSGQNNIIYNKSMYALGVYGLDEPKRQQLKEPHGITANRYSDVYVADTGNHRIVRLFNPGDQLKYVNDIGSFGNAAGAFNRPQQVAIDSKGNIYITDTGNNRVQVFDKKNQFRFSFDREQTFISPRAVAVTDQDKDYQYFRDGFIVVTDSLDRRISIMDLNGQLLKTARIQQTGFQTGKIEYAAIDYYNQILLTDSQNHCIHKFDKNLKHITSFGSYGDDDFQFNEPRGIAIYRRFGQLFVAEKTGAQYYWVGSDVSIDTITQNKKEVIFQIYLSEPSFIKAWIFDEQDRIIRILIRRLFINKAGHHTFAWDRKSGHIFSKTKEEYDLSTNPELKPGTNMPPGKYKIKVISEATYSSRTYFEDIEEMTFKSEF